jgi:nucleoid-associated protein YgaU
MGSEAKLGLVFVGILLTVFCALLLKRLTKPTTLPTASLAGSAAAKSGESTRAMPPVAPKVITPESNISNPPDYAGNSRNLWASAKNLSSPTGSSNYGETSRTTTGTSLSSAPESGKYQAPAILPTATPIADVGNQSNQYAGAAASQPIERSPQNSAASPSADESKSSTPLPVYQSAYGGADGYQSRSSNNVNPPNYERTNDPQARIDSPAAPSASSNTGFGSSQNYQSHPADATATAGYDNSTPASTRNSAAVAMPGYSASDPFVAGNPKRTANQTVGQTTGSQNQTGQFSAGQTTANQAYTNQSYSNQNNNSQTYHAANTVTGANTIAAAAIATAAPVERNGDQYTVQPNDSYWTISEKVYGTGGYFKALYEHNRKRSKVADELKLGQVLIVPDEGVLRRLYPDLCPKPRKTVASAQQRLTSATGRLRGPGRTYTVTEGDTLFEIARHELGKPSRWAEIYDLNRDVLGEDTDYLRPGTELILPVNSDSSPRNNTANRQPESLYPR